MKSLLRTIRAALSADFLSALPAAARPVTVVVSGICVDCDQKTAINGAGCCCRCGSSSVFVPGTRRLPTSVRVRLERQSKRAEVIRAALDRVERATVAKDAEVARRGAARSRSAGTPDAESRRVN